MKREINNHIENHLQLISNNLLDISKCVEKITSKIKQTLKKKRTIFFAGNGGSAADCEHLAAELIGKYKKIRSPYKALALTTNSSVMSCIANDFGFEKVFERQLQGLGQKGDLLIVFSTSGKSKNIVNVVKLAKKLKIFTIGLLGNDGGPCKNLCDFEYIVPSSSTANIQEVHHIIGHMFCRLID